MPVPEARVRFWLAAIVAPPLKVESPVTPKVPAIEVLPLEAVTLNLLELMLKSPVTPKVPATDVLPEAALTWNLLVLTAKSPVEARVPPTVVFPVKVEIPSIVRAPLAWILPVLEIETPVEP